jgi:hypothetical protein
MLTLKQGHIKPHILLILMFVQFSLTCVQQHHLYLPLDDIVQLLGSIFRFLRRYYFLEEINESDSSNNVGVFPLCTWLERRLP